MHKNRQRETKQVFTKRKIGKHLVNIAMLGLTLTPAVSAISSVYAEEAANDATASTDVSAQLKAAIEKAKSLGIKVDSTEKKTFQSTAELNDFNAKQLAQLNEAIAKAEKNVSTSKADEEEYNKAKAEYDKKKADYDKQKADYDKAKSTYDAAKTKYDADLKTYEAAKTKYDSDLKAYETAKSKYDSDLKAYESSTASNKKAKEEYDKKKAEYDTAKAKYDADLKTYETAKADYDRKLAEYESGSANDKKAQEEYARKKAEYDAAKAKYDSDLAKYNAEKAEYDRNKDKLGYVNVGLLTQKFNFKSEPNARIQIQGQYANIKSSALRSKKGNIFFTSMSQYSPQDYTSQPELTEPINDSAGASGSYPIIMEKNRTVTVTYTGLENSSYAGRKITKVVYRFTPTILGSTTGKAFAKIYKDPTDTIAIGSELLIGRIEFNFEAEFYYENGERVNFKPTDPALFSLSSLNASNTRIGSLEGASSDPSLPSQYYEYVRKSSDQTFYKINGSSVDLHGDMIYSDTNNNGIGSWDSNTAPNQWYGAGIIQSSGDVVRLKVGATDDRNYWFKFDSNVKTVTTTMNKPTEPTPPTPPGNTSRTAPTAPTKPTPPTPPTPLVIPDTPKPEEPKKPTEPTKPTEPKAPTAPVEPTAPVKKTTNNSDPISVKIAEASIVITKHIDITTGKELHPQEEGTKPKRSFDGYEFVETKTKDGNTIHYYKPVDKTPIKPKEDKAITKHFDITTGKEIAPQEDGNQPKKDIPNYEFVETKTKTGETDHYYKPISKPITRHIDKDTGKDIVPPEDGNKPKKDIPGYRFVETKDKDGNTYHYYQKVHTRHYDITTGKELVPQEDGTQPKKDIPNYEFVETKDKDGDTEHFYRPIKKVYTKHIDKKTGKELVPQEDGKQPKKDIPGYRFVETKDEDGNTIHYYEQVITKHLEVGTNKELAPQEDGQQPKKDIEGYEFVETKDENGDTIHYYKPVKKVYTKHIDKSTGKELAPQEDGKQPKREFDGYKFVETKDEDGNTIHYYEPIAKVITKHIDIDTNEEIAPQEDGKQPKKDISGYEFVETKDDNGNTLHYYRKVKKPAAIKGKTPAKYADTNEAAGIVQSVIGALGLTSLAGFGFWKKRKK